MFSIITTVTRVEKEIILQKRHDGCKYHKIPQTQTQKSPEIKHSLGEWDFKTNIQNILYQTMKPFFKTLTFSVDPEIIIEPAGFIARL